MLINLCKKYSRVIMLLLVCTLLSSFLFTNFVVYAHSDIPVVGSSMTGDDISMLGAF